MTPELKARLAKVYELVQRGATEGEKAAARKALDRLVDKYDLHGIDYDCLFRQWRLFTYNSVLEAELLQRVAQFVAMAADRSAFRQAHNRRIGLHLTDLEFITTSAAYEYFRRHMKAQWKKTCAGEVARKRKARTRTTRRKELQERFRVAYFTASGLVDESELTIVRVKSDAERADIRRTSQVEGGTYRQQLTTEERLLETTA